jgi:hypothetical protein
MKTEKHLEIAHNKKARDPDALIDSLGWDGKHRDTRKHCEDGHEKEDGALREGIATRARHDCNSHIACMIIRCIPPHAAASWLAAAFATWALGRSILFRQGRTVTAGAAGRRSDACRSAHGRQLFSTFLIGCCGAPMLALGN